MKPTLKKVSFLLVFVLIFGLFVIPVNAAPYSTGTYVVNANNGINVRSGSGTNYSVVGSATNRTQFEVSRISGNWGYSARISCTNGNKSGWICLDYCQYKSSEPPSNVHGRLFASTKGKGDSFKTAYNNRSSTFTKGTLVYAWGGIVDDNNNPLDAYACTMKLSIYKPNGKCYYTYTYNNTSNNWIGCRYNTVGTWTIAIELTGKINAKTTRKITIKNPAPVQPTSVSLDRTSITLPTGTYATLHATVYPSNASNRSVTWSTADSDVVTVAPDGAVCAKNPGWARVFAKTTNGKVAVCYVTVKGIKINEGDQSVHQGDVIKLRTTRAEVSTEKDKWKSSKSSVVSVDSKGQITAKRPGSAKITVTTADGFSDYIYITVVGIKTESQKNDISKNYVTVNLNAGKSAGYICIYTWNNMGLSSTDKVSVTLKDNTGKEIKKMDVHPKDKIKLPNDRTEYRVYVTYLRSTNSNRVKAEIEDLDAIGRSSTWKVKCLSNAYII